MPDDSVVQENCGYLLDIEEAHSRSQHGQGAALLGMLTKAAVTKARR